MTDDCSESSISRRTKAFRLTAGLSTSQLAKLVGTSRQNIENLEAGKVLIPGYIVPLADTIGCSTDDLLRSDSPQASRPSDLSAMNPMPDRAPEKELGFPPGLSRQAIALAHLLDSIDDPAARTRAYAAILECVTNHIKG